MLMTTGQDDSIFIVISIICAVLLFVFVITAKNLDAELRKPFVAMLVSTLAGIVIYVSKAIPMAVMGILCFGLLAGIVSNIIKFGSLKHKDPSYPQTLNLQKTLSLQDKKANSLIDTESVKLLLPTLSIVVVLVFFGFIFLLFNKSQFGSLMSLLHPFSSSVSTTQGTMPSASPVLAHATPAKVDAKREAALKSYQQAKIDHETSIHSVETEWSYLSKNAAKHDVNTWLNSQQAWKISKRHVCGQVDDAPDLDRLAAIELNSNTKVLRCDTDANFNRASYIKNSVDAMIKGHKPNDDIGNLIQNLNNK